MRKVCQDASKYGGRIMELNLGKVKILIKAENLDKALKDAKNAYDIELSKNNKSGFSFN